MACAVLHCTSLNHPHTLWFWRCVSIQICTRVHTCCTCDRTKANTNSLCSTGWLKHLLVQTTACEDGEALQQVFIGYNGSVWQWFSLSHCLSLSDTDNQQNCALRNLERSLSFKERNKTGPKTEAWENNLQRNTLVLLRDRKVLCWFCHELFVWIAGGCLC